MGTPFIAAPFHDAPAALPAIIRGGAELANIGKGRGRLTNGPARSGPDRLFEGK
jgi:hypothetical protein